jgi:chromosome segregation ATPase
MRQYIYDGRKGAGANAEEGNTVTLTQIVTAAVWMQTASGGIEWQQYGEIIAVLGAIAGVLITLWRSKVELRDEMQEQYLAFVDEQSKQLSTERQKREVATLRVDELEEKLSIQTLQIERGRNETDNLIESNQKLRSDIQRQHREFTSEMEQVQRLHAEQVKALERRIEEQARQIRNLEAKLEAMEAQRDIDKRKINALRGMVDSLNVQVETLLATNKELRSALRDTTTNSNLLRAERDNLHKELIRLEAKLQNTQDELNRLREVVHILENKEERRHDDEQEAVRVDADGAVAGAGDAGGGDGAG